MVKIVIDQGNSAIKAGIFDKQTMIAVNSIPNNDKRQLLKFIEKYQPQSAIVSSVTNDLKDEWLQGLIPKIISFNDQIKLPFINRYLTPETLGRDRIAAVAGAQLLYPDTSILVLDAGTCVKFDLLLSNQHYLGGSISPGLEMRFKALNQFTEKLPLGSKNQKSDFPGATTAESIASGIINGMIFEMEGYREFCRNKWDTTHTIITGGDSDFFARKLKKPIFVNQNLVLLGLNRILDHNA